MRSEDSQESSRALVAGVAAIASLIKMPSVARGWVGNAYAALRDNANTAASLRTPGEKWLLPTQCLEFGTRISMNNNVDIDVDARIKQMTRQ